MREIRGVARHPRRRVNRLVEWGILCHAIACTVCLLGGMVICAGSTILWFTTAPLLPDTIEYQIARPILPAGGISFTALLWGAAVGSRLSLWRQSQREAKPISDIDWIDWPEPPKTQKGDCWNCKYRSSDVVAISNLKHPCGVNPYGKPFDICPDWEAR